MFHLEEKVCLDRETVDRTLRITKVVVWRKKESGVAMTEKMQYHSLCN